MKQIYNHGVTVLLLVLITPLTLSAQIFTTAIKPGQLDQKVWFHSVEVADRVVMPSIDFNALQAEDKRAAKEGLPQRYGKALSVDLDPQNAGKWDSRSINLGRVWKLNIHSPEALAIQLTFDDFYLPDSAELFIYNEDQTVLMGPITAANNRESRYLVTDLINGSSVVIELFEPNGHIGQSKLHIKKVVHTYNNESKSIPKNYTGFGDAAPCHIDITCSPWGNAWKDDEANAVAMILDGQQRLCTGALLNNGCQDYTPIFLTAFHCADVNLNGRLSAGEVSTVQNDWVFRFGYKSPTCNGPDDFDFVWFNGSTIRAAWAGSDFLLVELNSRPAGETGIKMLGYNRSSTNPGSRTTMIHHPNGDVMKISIDNGAPTVTDFDGDGLMTYWRVVFDQGTVEPGSSGAPLFDWRTRVIGQLRGNDDNICPGTDNNNCFCTQTRAGQSGMLSASWTGGDQDGNGRVDVDERLNAWLTNDPNVITTDKVGIPWVSDSRFLICGGAPLGGWRIVLNNAPSNPPLTPIYNVAWSVTSNMILRGSSQSVALVSRNGSQSGYGTISATVTNQNGALCPVSNTFTRQVYVGPFRSSDLSVSGPVPACVGNNVKYTAHVPGGHVSGYTYSWNMPSGWTIVSQLANTVTVRPNIQTGGPLGVSVTTPCGTGSTTGITVFSVNCFQSAAAQAESFKLFPNPAANTFTIEHTGNSNELGVYQVNLYDDFGVRVRTMRSSERQTKISTTGLRKGVYVLKILYKDGVLTRRIILEK